ncbi:hypothetical protein D0863_09735 [Hortaea werneckii]|uniref:Uncharacterized protein n=1 Tax=Hortaea werneckii TaxID=91943 RepID=A0A3M7DJN7_HORWE|nr:hypothetical protein D0863_09735 [Hortaea werneckii]
MAGYSPVPPPEPEARQDDYITNRPWGSWHGHARDAPREYPYIEHNAQLGGWWQGPVRLRNFKPNLYFTRPHDGKRTGGFGRLKDALTGEGPDVFVTISGDKRTLMRDRPQKWQWSEWALTDEEQDERIEFDKDLRYQDLEPIIETPWAQRSGWHKYNFRTRKFEHPRWSWLTDHDKVWRDATWAPGAKRRDMRPLNKRNIYGEWESRVPWQAGYWCGGRPRIG